MGHQKERHEYTIIGPKVNMAARIMMHYPGIVSTDQATRDQAKLAPWLYKAQPYKFLKGVKNPGTIYEYSEKQENDTEYFLGLTEISEPKYPLLGQDEAIEELSVEWFHLSNTSDHGMIRRLIVIEGPAGIGKTRLLQEVAFQAQESNNLVVYATLTITDAACRFSTIKMCLSLMLKLNELHTKSQRKQALMKLLAGTEFVNELYLLNPILNLDFTSQDGLTDIEFMTKTQEYKKKIRDLIKNMVTIVRKKNKNKHAVVFCLDDIQNIHEESWDILLALAKDKQSLVIGTIRSNKYTELSASARNLCNHPNTKKLEVRKISHTPQYQNLACSSRKKSLSDLDAICCQMLEVRQIDEKIRDLVAKNYFGNPFWAYAILRELENKKLIEFKPIGDGSEN